MGMSKKISVLRWKHNRWQFLILKKRATKGHMFLLQSSFLLHTPEGKIPALTSMTTHPHTQAHAV